MKYESFEDFSGRKVVLRQDAIWAVVVDPVSEPCEVLLVGGTQAIKVSRYQAVSLQNRLVTWQ